MAETLTPQQKMAVTNRGGKLLVSAAAGSGKTKVLVERLLCYLTDMSAPAQLDDFLIITYTKAAASELRGKIGAELTSRIAAEPENRHLQKQLQRLYLTQISTVHGFCAATLSPRALSIRPSDAAVIPFPRPETTPPVTKMYFVINIPPYFIFFFFIYFSG